MHHNSYIFGFPQRAGSSGGIVFGRYAVIDCISSSTIRVLPYALRILSSVHLPRAKAEIVRGVCQFQATFLGDQRQPRAFNVAAYGRVFPVIHSQRPHSSSVTPCNGQHSDDHSAEFFRRFCRALRRRVYLPGCFFAVAFVPVFQARPSVVILCVDLLHDWLCGGVACYIRGDTAWQGVLYSALSSSAVLQFVK